MPLPTGRQAIGGSVKLGTFGMEGAFARRIHTFAKPRECTEAQQPRPQSEVSPTPRAREQTEAHTRARPGNPETARHRPPLRWRNGLDFDTSAPTPCRSAASAAAKAGSISASNTVRFAIRRSSAGWRGWRYRRRMPTCGGCRRASSGDGTRCRRPTPIPLSRTMGERARVAQEPPPCSFSGRAAPHPTTDHPVLGHEAWHARTPARRIIELVTRSAIRAGNETYTRLRGTRGAVTLLKSNVTVRGKLIMLRFRSKGGKTITKEISAPQLAKAVQELLQLPGRRLFQYQSESGVVRVLTAHDVNTCLREMAGTRISLKDFRTLIASARVLETLARVKPAPRERQRRKQVRAAVSAAADDLANTPTICRKSYVHESVVRAFEQGVLERFSTSLKHSRSPIGRARVLEKIYCDGGQAVLVRGSKRKRSRAVSAAPRQFQGDCMPSCNRAPLRRQRAIHGRPCHSPSSNAKTAVATSAEASSD